VKSKAKTIIALPRICNNIESCATPEKNTHPEDFVSKDIHNISVDFKNIDSISKIKGFCAYGKQ
jgi:hypothetical protein